MAVRTPPPGRLAWIEAVTPIWAARAAALSVDPHPSAGVRAAVLNAIVARLRAEIPAPCSVDPVPIAELERRLAATQPYRHPEYGMMVNDHPLLDSVDHRLRCRLAALRGEPAPAFVHLRGGTMASVAAMVPLPPVPEAIPFTAGPQLSLFEIAA